MQGLEQGIALSAFCAPPTSHKKVPGLSVQRNCRAPLAARSATDTRCAGCRLAA